MQWLEEETREGDVAGSNPAGLVAADFTRKIPEMGGQPVGASTN